MKKVFTVTKKPDEVIFSASELLKLKLQQNSSYYSLRNYYIRLRVLIMLMLSKNYWNPWLRCPILTQKWFEWESTFITTFLDYNIDSCTISLDSESRAIDSIIVTKLINLKFVIHLSTKHIKLSCSTCKSKTLSFCDI